MQLLDADAYADVKSIREAMNRRRAPFYLRRTKEAMVYFPERREDGSWVGVPPRPEQRPCRGRDPDAPGDDADGGRSGELIAVRTLIAHPMETGQRVDSGGERLPRDIVRRLEARLNGELVFAADLHPAIAANPYIVFALRVAAGGTLTIDWSGDRGFAHRERVEIVAT